MFFFQEEKLRGVSVWNVRETGGQESHFGACICPTLALVKVFLVDTIIELLLKRSGDIIKFVAGPLPDVYLKAPLFFRGFLTITQKHGRKLASQLGEVLFVCQFYDLQIVKKTSLSLRNLWLHLVQLCVCPSSPQRHYTLLEG